MLWNRGKARPAGRLLPAREPGYMRILRNAVRMLVALALALSAVLSVPAQARAESSSATVTPSSGAATEPKASPTPSASPTSAAPEPSEKPTPAKEPTPSDKPTPAETPTPSTTPTPAETPTPAVTPTAPVDTPKPPAPEPSVLPPPDSGSAPTILSDLEDYAPGGTVVLTGTGWQPGEVVTIVVNDTGGFSWSLKEEVVADAEGRIALTFDLPPYFVPNYDVTATGPLSGTATTTFTDASRPYLYWMLQSAPAATTTVTGGTQITYNVYGQRNGGNNVTDAVITLTLSGTSSATFDASGQPTTVTISNGGRTATWRPASLGSTSTTVAIRATVTSDAPGGTVIATVTGDANGTFNQGGTGANTRYRELTHSVTGPIVNTCDFATPGSGAYANSICWFDLTGYNATTAASTNGQTMRQTLPGGYSLTYTIKASGTTVTAATLPTWSGAYLGNTASGVGGYYGISGRPAL